MKQQTIFDYLDLEQDAVYLSIKGLKENEVFSFGDISVSKINHYYEIECDYCHELLKSTIDCYKRLNEVNDMNYNKSL